MAGARWTIKWTLSPEGTIYTTVDGERPPFGPPDSWGGASVERQVTEVGSTIIGEEILTEAAYGHIERLGRDNGIMESLIELDVSPDEVGNAIGALVNVRAATEEVDRPTYLAAALDGFILCARAFRIAEAQDDAT